MKVLFICTMNELRSATAQQIYAEDERFEVRSAGTDASANVPVSPSLFDWATAIVVMEPVHRNQIRKRFPYVYQTKPIICLYIPDDYDFMQPELIARLRQQFESAYARGLLRIKQSDK